MTDITELKGQIQDLQAEVSVKTKEVSKVAEEAIAKLKSELGDNQNFKDYIDELVTKSNEEITSLNDAIANLKRDTAELLDGGANHKGYHSAGEELVKSKDFKDMDLTGGTKKLFNLQKSITVGGENSAGVLIRPEFAGHIVAPDRQLTILDLITNLSMSGNQIYYTREKGFTNNAAVVAEGAKKPESLLTFEDVTETAKKIAHYINISQEALSDVPQIQSIIDGRLRYGLEAKLEDQILNGDGTTNSLNGIIKQASEFDPSLIGVTDATMIDSLRIAILQVLLAEYPASGHVLNPMDWAAIELAKDKEARYILANPQSTAQPTMWGLPVVQTQAITKGKFLTGAFKLGAEYFHRWGTTVMISTENEDNFIHNKATILAEQRGALAVTRPEAFVYGDLAPAVAGEAAGAKAATK